MERPGIGSLTNRRIDAARSCEAHRDSVSGCQTWKREVFLARTSRCDSRLRRSGATIETHEHAEISAKHPKRSGFSYLTVRLRCD